LANSKCRFREFQVFSFNFQAGLDDLIVLLSYEGSKARRKTDTDFTDYHGLFLLQILPICVYLRPFFLPFKRGLPQQ
jgi:hypothetical protein